MNACRHCRQSCGETVAVSTALRRKLMDGDPDQYAQSLRQLRSQLQVWIRARLWLQVAMGLLGGLGVGFLLGPEMQMVTRETSGIAGGWLALPGKFFLGLIAMGLVPIVLVSIVQGITGSESLRQLRAVGFRFLVFVLLTKTAASLLGIGLALKVMPGEYMPASAAFRTEAVPPQPTTEEAQEKLRILRESPQVIARMLPSNPAKAITDQDMLAIVIIAILFGLACNFVPRERIEVLLKALDGLLQVAMVGVKWAMFLAPWAVFGMTAQLVSSVGLGTLRGTAAYAATVVAGLLLLFVLYLLAILILARKNPVHFLKAIGGVLLLAFSTSSSAAVMPLSINAAVKRLGVPENIANLVIPLGATVNMAGTALYQSIAVIFLAQISGVVLSASQIAVVVITLVASSVGAPGTPGVGMVILANVVGGLGIPTTGLAIILGIDRILDMCRTTVNVTGDLVACVLFRKLAIPPVPGKKAAAS